MAAATRSSTRRARQTQRALCAGPPHWLADWLKFSLACRADLTDFADALDSMLQQGEAPGSLSLEQLDELGQVGLSVCLVLCEAVRSRCSRGWAAG